MLNLVLVDFKGGATFLGFERVRHVAAVITNLSDEAALVARMKDALAGEITRRQELLRAAGNFANVADYDKARAAGAPLAPLPALVVIVDEFAELLSAHPDFVDVFVAIGRVGRSLRIHLLLATQRFDEGRLRGLEAHLSYRICLKTFSANESRSVIGTPDAFHLEGSPGAAYLQVGSEAPAEFQSAYVSEPYVATVPGATGSRVPAVQVFTAQSVIGEPVTAGTQVETGTTVLDAVLNRLTGRGTPAHRVWLAPLAASPTLGTLLGGAGELRVPIGLVDKPFAQRRDRLILDLSGSAGNLAIIGAPQSGKSVAARTLIMALAACHSPEQVQCYCLDFGGGGLSAMADLPHVGALAARSDTDLARRIVAQLTTIMRSRAERFRRLGIDSMSDYRARRAACAPALDGDPYGDVFLVIDGWAVLREEFEDLETAITALTAQGLSYGVHVVLTASRWAEIRPACKDQLGARIELRLGDGADSELNRKAAQQVPFDRPGRGIIAGGDHLLIALPRLDSGPTNASLSEAISRAVMSVKARWGDRRAPAVRLLPDHVDHGEVVARAGAARSARRTLVTIGLEEDGLGPIAVDFGEQPHLLILGEPESGKTAALRLICTELVRTNSPAQAMVMIVDVRRTLLGVVGARHLLGYAGSAGAAATSLAELVKRVRARLPGPDVDHRALRSGSWWSGPELYLIVDDYDLVGTSTDNPLTPIAEFLPHARDLGLHMVVARRSGGAGRALFEPLLARLRDVGCMGLMLSASPDEGVLLGAARAGPLAAGRARLVTRADERLVQLAWVPPCP